MARDSRRGFFRRLADMLFVEDQNEAEEPAPDPAGDAAAPPAPARPATAAAPAPRTPLADALKEGRPGVAGKLQFFDLGRLKAAVGERWPDIADKARMVTERVIAQRLAATDRYEAYGEDGFLILFANLSEEEARLKAEAIAQEILTRLTGEAGNATWVKAFVGEAGPAPAAAAGAPEDERMVSADAMHSRITIAIAEGTAGSVGKTQFLNLDQIKAQFGDRWEAVAYKARLITEQVIRRWLSPADVYARMEDDAYMVLFAELTPEQARLKVAAIARAIQERLLGELDVGDRHKVKGFVADVASLASLDPPPSLEDISRALEAGGDVAQAAHGSGIDAELQSRMGEVGVTYQPTWAAQRQVVGIYRARPMRLDERNLYLAGAAAYPRHDPPVAFEIDRAVLHRTLVDLRRLVAQDGKAMVIAPVRLSSLVQHSGGQLVDLCRALPVEVRRHLVVEIADLGAAAMLARLGDGAAAVQPFCRAVAARVPFGFAAFEILGRHRIASVVVDLEEAADGAATAEHLAAMVHGAKAHKLSLHLYGIASAEVVRLAQQAGIDYLNGPAVVREAAQPAGIYAFRPA